MQTRDVHLYVCDTLADWEIGYAIAHINSPQFQKQPGRYRVQTLGATKRPVTTMGGVTIVPDLALESWKPSESALLILPGGDRWDRKEQQGVLEIARDLPAQGVPVAAICGATAALAQLGLLDTRKHTSNAKQYLEMQPGYHGSAHYLEQPAVSDGNVITAGATGALTFARAIFERLELYSERVLSAWYGLYGTGEARYYFELLQAA